MSLAFTPESIAGISDPDFEKTNLYTKNLTQYPLNTAFAGVRDTGGTNAIAPVLNELSRNAWAILALANGPAEEILTNPQYGFNLQPYINPEAYMRNIEGDAVITGLSEVPSIEVGLNYAAHRRQKKVFGIEDYPGSYQSELRAIFAKNRLVSPDSLFVGNEWARQANAEAGFAENNIHALGFPALDSLARMNKAQVRSEIRQKLGIAEDELVIGWFGQRTGATIEHLAVFLNGLKLLDPKDYRLVFRLHPRDDNPLSSYEQILGSLKNRVVYAGRDVVPDANEVIAAINFGVNERSTVSIQGAALGVPFISLAIDEIIQRYGVMLGLKVPVIEDGTSPAVYKPEQMADVLNLVLTDSNYQAELATKMTAWQSDGKSAQRIANKIIELV